MDLRGNSPDVHHVYTAYSPSIIHVQLGDYLSAHHFIPARLSHHIIQVLAGLLQFLHHQNLPSSTGISSAPVDLRHFAQCTICVAPSSDALTSSDGTLAYRRTYAATPGIRLASSNSDQSAILYTLSRGTYGYKNQPLARAVLLENRSILALLSLSQSPSVPLPVSLALTA